MLNNVEDIQSVVKKVKIDTSLDQKCDYSMPTQVKAVEQKLQIESSEQINDILSNEELKAAAGMFIYLNTCPDSWFKSWFSFYKKLFLTQPANQIILTLNRMMKTKTSQEDKYAKIRTGNLLLRVKSLLSLKFDDIQSLLQEEKYKNGSTKDFMTSNGMF